MSARLDLPRITKRNTDGKVGEIESYLFKLVQDLEYQFNDLAREIREIKEDIQKQRKEIDKIDGRGA